VEEMKRCKMCGEEKPATNKYFHNEKRNNSGLDGTCKVCRAKNDKRTGNKKRDAATASRKLAECAYTLKQCSDCKKFFPRNDNYFPTREDSKDGLRGECRECLVASHKVYYKENVEAITERNKRYVEEHKEDVTAYKHLYYKEHSAECIKKQRIYQIVNIESYRKYQNKYRREHPEYRRVQCQRYRSKKRKLPSTLTVEQWDEIKAYFDNQCCYCGREKPLVQEHFLSVTKDGEYATTNIVPSCVSCNVSKSNHSFFEWYPNHRSYSPEREVKILSYLGYKNGKQQLTLF